MPAPTRTAVLAVVALLVTTLLSGAQSAAGVRPVNRVPAATATGASVADGFRSARTYPVVAVPVRLHIPALHVDSRLQRLGLQPDGAVAVPASPHVPGWYEGGARPGQAGPAVILGHVDSRTGPGVFINLRRVRSGTLVQVDRTDGSSVTFRVTTVSRVPKDRFPTDLVYGPTLDPTLRLVTCGGSFDRARGHYRDNVIAFAELV